VALIAAGQSSTLTGTLTGQIIMEGFLNIRLQPWLRRLITRSIALLPAVVVIAISGSEGTYKLLILSQVVLSLQLPFATIPLIHFTSDKKKMGEFANNSWLKLLSWIVAAIIVVLNLKLVLDELTGWLTGASFFLWLLIIPATAFILGVLAYITFSPFFGISREWESGIVRTGTKIAKRIHPITFKNIAVALENSDRDVDIISAAITMAKKYRARLTLLHVSDTPGTMVYGDESSSLHSRQDSAYLENLALEIEERDLPVETLLLFGDPANALIEAINKNGFDLLIAGAHGHKMVGDLVHGATIDKVRHEITIPVLIVRTHEAKKE